jgi:hypothetical protein
MNWNLFKVFSLRSSVRSKSKLRSQMKLELLEARWLPSILHVGPGEPFELPSQAAVVAQDGDDIQIDPGLYQDVAIWRANNLTIEGVGGLAHIDANGGNAEGKGIWVIKGNNTIVQNIEFSGATVRDHNGAGIRQEGASLQVLDCYFHDNEEGILTGANAASDIDIEYSEFARNGYGDGYSHNMYIGHVRSFTLLGSYSHDAIAGHDIKSRADTNYILYNRIQDDTGDASYEIDLPNGGTSYLIGNVIRKGPRAQNRTVITSGEEGASNPNQEFYLINNTIVQDRSSGTYVQVLGQVSTIRLVNNIFAGQYALSSTILSGNNGELTSDLQEVNPGFVDPAHFDYHLIDGSDAIDGGTAPGMANNGFDLTPQLQYVDQAQTDARPDDGIIDIGAYEFSNPSVPSSDLRTIAQAELPNPEALAQRTDPGGLITQAVDSADNNCACNTRPATDCRSSKSATAHSLDLTKPHTERNRAPGIIRSIASLELVSAAKLGLEM